MCGIAFLQFLTKNFGSYLHFVPIARTIYALYDDTWALCLLNILFLSWFPFAVHSLYSFDKAFSINFGINDCGNIPIKFREKPTYGCDPPHTFANTVFRLSYALLYKNLT